MAWLCAGLAVAGSTVGNGILFWTARTGGRHFMRKTGPESRAVKFRYWFRRYGMVTVFVPAMVPIPMPLKLFVVSAGVLGTPWSQFMGVILFARALRYFGEAWLGVRLGRESMTFLASHAWQFAAGAVALCLLLYGFIRLRDRARPPSDL
jgi:membrane protein YqaA with SNARE-associated domain